MAKKKGENDAGSNLALMRLENRIDRGACDEETVVDRLAEFIEAIPRDAPVQAVYEGFVKVRDNVATVNDTVREVVAITRDDRVERLNNEALTYYDIAEKWAKRGPDITLREACHGVAHDAYALRFNESIPRPTPEGPFNPSKVYGGLYEVNLAEEIKARQIRAARDLFGHKK